jgi:hypothetical protein
VGELELPVGPQKLPLQRGAEHQEREIDVTPGGKVVIDTW